MIVAHVQNPAEHFESFRYTDFNTLLREIGGLQRQMFVVGTQLYLEHPDTKEPQLVNKGDYLVRRVGDSRFIRIPARAYKNYQPAFGVGSATD